MNEVNDENYGVVDGKYKTADGSYAVINEDCPCVHDCVRHGKCLECIAHHSDRESCTACGK